MCRFPGVADVNVYGVAVPGAEGRVGMAAIKFKGALRFEDFEWQVCGVHAWYGWQDTNSPGRFDGSHP